MKKIFLFCTVCLVLMTGVSCSKASQDPEPFPKTVDYKVVAEKTIPRNEFLDSLSSSFESKEAAKSFAATVPQNMTFESLTVNYTSVDQNGKDVTLSGIVIIPKIGGKFTAGKIALNNRATQLSNSDVPSHNWNCGTIIAARNYVLVSSDLIGFGASVDRPVNFCCNHLAGRNSLDLVIAAQQILHEEQRGLGLGGRILPFINTGYSQGGYSALAVHRYWECNATETETQMAPLERSFCGAGPYSLNEMMDFHFGNGTSLYTPYLVLGLMSAMDYHPELFTGYKIEDFLAPEATEMKLVDKIREKKTGNQALIVYVLLKTGIAHSLDHIFKKEVMTKGTELNNVVSNGIAAENVLTGWIPAKRPIKFYHAYEDDCVPSTCTMAAEKAFKSSTQVDFIWDSSKKALLLHATVEKYFNEWLLSIL